MSEEGRVSTTTCAVTARPTVVMGVMRWAVENTVSNTPVPRPGNFPYIRRQKSSTYISAGISLVCGSVCVN